MLLVDIGTDMSIFASAGRLAPGAASARVTTSRPANANPAAPDILRTIFHMLARLTHFSGSTVDYEALSVARNAVAGR